MVCEPDLVLSAVAGAVKGAFFLVLRFPYLVKVRCSPEAGPSEVRGRRSSARGDSLRQAEAPCLPTGPSSSLSEQQESSC